MHKWMSGLVLSGAAIAACTQTSVEPTDSIESFETHPYQARLVCERAPGSTLVGVLYNIASGTKARIADYASLGNVGACEIAVRASRNNKVCVTKSWSSYTVRDLVAKTETGTYSKLTDCTAVTRGGDALRTEPGYLDFIPPNEVAPFIAAIPQVSDSEIDAALRDPQAIWYDESSMTFVYQDSFGDPKGLRANRVGYDVGSNASEPDIRALTEYFKPGKFKFPFSVAAGADFADNTYALNFWLPPKDSTGKTLPVRVWSNNSHWQWVFPVGTFVGEILFMQAPDDKSWVPFEIRVRLRKTDKWETSVFRPFVSATSLSTSIQAKRPAWATTPDLKALVDHLELSSSLEAFSLESPPYAALFPKMTGALDYLPSTTDTALIKELLRENTFQKANGTVWKADGTKTTFAASTHASFHIVPKDYIGGMFEVSDTSCRRCHEQTSRPLNNLDPRVVLYGEVWGEDEVFTWHPFAIEPDTFSVADGNRRMNDRLVSAGLVERLSPASDPAHYTTLTKPYVTKYE